MKIWTFFLNFILFPALIFSQSPCHITFEIEEFQGKNALIAYHFGDKQYILDTLERDANDKFVLQSDTLLNGGLYLFVLPPRNVYFEFLIDSKDNQVFKLTTDTTDFIKNMKVIGSKQNEIFFEDVRFISEKRKEAEEMQTAIKAAGNDSVKIKKIQIQLKELDQQVIAKRGKIVSDNPTFLYSAMLKATKEPEIPAKTAAQNDSIYRIFQYNFYKTHFWDNIDFTDDRLLRTPILLGKLNQYLDKVCSANPDSLSKEMMMLIKKTETGKNFEMLKFMIVTLLNYYANSKILGQDIIYVRIAEEYYCSGKALAWTDTITVKRICDRVYPPKGCGLMSIAPELKIPNQNGKLCSLHEIKAEYIVLFFWDNQDSISLTVGKQIGSIIKYYRSRGHKIGFYTVLAEGNRQVFEENIRALGWEDENYIHTADPNHLTDMNKKYDILSTPRTFILDKDKKIIAKYISPKQCDEIFNHYLYGKDEAAVIKEENGVNEPEILNEEKSPTTRKKRKNKE